MSLIAISYAKNLVRAPDGSKITATEKAVLLVLADWHNDGLGFAWPSMELLAEKSGISGRHCRRVVAGLVRKRVLGRVGMCRADSGGQTSNEYIFLELDSPKPSPETAKIRRKLQLVRRIPMSGSPRRSRPPQAVLSVRPTETHASYPPGHGRPALKPLGGSFSYSLNDPPGEPLAPEPGGAARMKQSLTMKSLNTPPMKAKQSPFSDLGLAQSAWEKAKDAIRKIHGAKDLKLFRFNDSNVIEVTEDGAGNIVVALRSPKSEATERGIRKHCLTIGPAMQSFYGRDVKLVVLGTELAETPISGQFVNGFAAAAAT
jgi:hypothetical protein